MQMATQYKNGSITGTGAAINVECGFIPRKVKLFNVTDNVTLEWNDAMTDGRGVQKIADGTTTYVAASTGISKGTRLTLLGFILGTAAINSSGDTILWEAWE